MPNVARFREQADALVAMIGDAALTPEQMTNDLDFQQSMAQLFTLIPYAQLILEQAQLDDTPQDVVDTIFETLVRDFSATAVELHGKASSTADQQAWAIGEHPQARGRRGPQRPHLRRGPRARGRVRDAQLSSQSAERCVRLQPIWPRSPEPPLRPLTPLLYTFARSRASATPERGAPGRPTPRGERGEP